MKLNNNSNNYYYNNSYYYYYFDVRNFGVTGSSIVVPYSSMYVTKHAYQQAIDYQPHIILLVLGTNDAKQISKIVSSKNLSKKYFHIINSFITNNNNNNDNDDEKQKHLSDVPPHHLLNLLPRIILGLPPAVQKPFFGITDKKVYRVSTLLKEAVDDATTTVNSSSTSTSSFVKIDEQQQQQQDEQQQPHAATLLLRRHLDYWVDLRELSLNYINQTYIMVDHHGMNNTTTHTTTTTTTTTTNKSSSVVPLSSSSSSSSVSSSSFYSKDGLHLSNYGYEKMAEAFYQTITCHVDGICKIGESCTSCPQDCGPCS